MSIEKVFRVLKVLSSTWVKAAIALIVVGLLIIGGAIGYYFSGGKYGDIGVDGCNQFIPLFL